MSEIKERRTRNLRYKRPALASMGFDVMIAELDEIEAACTDVRWFADQDDETLINALDGNERVRANPACHYGVRQAEIFLFGKVVTPRMIVEPVPFDLSMLDAWGKTVFKTEHEGRKIIDHDTTRASQAGPEGPGPEEPGPGGLL